MSITTGNIASIVSGRLEGRAEIEISGIVTDSRKVTSLSPTSLFIALKGSRSDGHIFIDSLYKAGVRAFLVDKSVTNNIDLNRFGDSAFIITENTLLALHKIATYKREMFNGVVIAITGSNGKTVVKEWFSDILGSQSAVLRSPRSYNSQTGVPLSVWNLDNSYDFGVFEAGMSMPGEIARLERIIKPDIAVLTNIGDAHQENFPDIDAKIREKLDLFSNCKTIIYSPDQEEVERMIALDEKLKDKEHFTWSFAGKKADVKFDLVSREDGSYYLKADHNGMTNRLKVIYSDKASIQNSAIVYTMLLKAGVPVVNIIDKMEQIKPVEMRMERKDGINGCTLIEDYYNSDPAALGIALDYLREVPGGSKMIIISDFVQQARKSASLYGEVAELIERAGVDEIICVGEEITSARSFFPGGALFFKDTEEFLKWFAPGKFANSIILIKGARKFEFEKISAQLQLKAHITTLEINLNNLRWNLNLYRSVLTEGTKTMAMVKAFAYGAGPRQISEWLTSNGVDFLSVAYIDEGISLRDAGISARIMVMNPDPLSFRALINNDLEPEIYSFETLRAFVAETGRMRIADYPVHIKLDTGMHRLGFMIDETDSLINSLISEPGIKVASIFSHLAASEDPGKDRDTHLQAKIFIESAQKIEESLGYTVIKHILNSAGITRFPEYHFDMVRLGIGLFGTGYNDIKLSKPVGSFKSSVSQVKRVKAGEGIGYGFTDPALQEREIAIIPIGYADGLNRRLGNGKGRVYIKSGFAPITGRICMDMCMVDVTGMGVKAGERVEIFGENISISEVAAGCDTIPYEIITAIPPRVKRVYLFD